MNELQLGSTRPSVGKISNQGRFGANSGSARGNSTRYTFALSPLISAARGLGKNSSP